MRGVTGVELHVSDVDASIRFYEALGFRVARRWEDWVRLDRDGAELVLQGDAYIRGHEHYFTPHIDRSPRGVGSRSPWRSPTSTRSTPLPSPPASGS